MRWEGDGAEGAPSAETYPGSLPWMNRHAREIGCRRRDDQLCERLEADVQDDGRDVKE